VSVSYDLLEGALGTLKRAPLTKTLVEHFQKAVLFKMCGMRKPPDQASLKKLTDAQDLIVWSVHPDGKPASVGYALFVAFNGPPFVSIYRFDEKLDIELARDCVMQLIHYFFQHTNEESLFLYQAKPVPADVHEALVEGGFDLFEDNPTLDPDEVCYVLERYTYVAYYGEGKGGRDGEFDNYADAAESDEDDAIPGYGDDD
jgi:hypothetical protein